MALSRCLEEHAAPRGRSVDYVGYVHPVGYPRTALVCGRRGCERPAVIWLSENDARAYTAGQRVFAGPNDFTKMRADDSGFTLFTPSRPEG